MKIEFRLMVLNVQNNCGFISVMKLIIYSSVEPPIDPYLISHALLTVLFQINQ